MVVQARFEEMFEFSRLQRILVERILPAKGHGGNLKFPEFQQFLTTFGGFYFWEWDPTFNIDDHVKVCMLSCYEFNAIYLNWQSFVVSSNRSCQDRS